MTGAVKALYDSILVQLLARLELDRRVAVSDRTEWHDITQSKTLAPSLSVNPRLVIGRLVLRRPFRAYRASGGNKLDDGSRWRRRARQRTTETNKDEETEQTRAGDERKQRIQGGGETDGNRQDDSIDADGREGDGDTDRHGHENIGERHFPRGCGREI